MARKKKESKQKTLFGSDVKIEKTYSTVPRRHPGYYKWKQGFREWKKKYQAGMCEWDAIPEQFKKYLKRIYNIS